VLICFRISLILFFLFTFFSPSNLCANQRDIKRLSDLQHESGKVGKYHALLIGIQNYKDSAIKNLKTPAKDVRQLEKLLESKYGFKVTTLINNQATKKSIYNSLRKISLDTKPEDSFLIYYAGHGELDKEFNSGWWLPYDAESGEAHTYVENLLIQKAMKSSKAKHILVVSDSCYSGSLFAEQRAIQSTNSDKYYLRLLMKRVGGG